MFEWRFPLFQETLEVDICTQSIIICATFVQQYFSAAKRRPRVSMLFRWGTMSVHMVGTACMGTGSGHIFICAALWGGPCFVCVCVLAA